MKLVQSLLAGVPYATHLFSFSSFDVDFQKRHPLDLQSPKPELSDSAVFNSPMSPSDIVCDYSHFDDGKWKGCSTSQDRSCWLRHPNGSEININTDYETVTPFTGLTRKYKLDVTNTSLNLDGAINHEAKVYNNQYPGPWLQACWGDDIEVEVTNHLEYNGTVVHWHGMRQLHSNLMDGANGVTQCPIPPNGSATYRFHTTQYGTSWYHSHYSLQYPDGLLGPLTIHGPSSAPWDETKDPILVSDWGHRSAFQTFQVELEGHPATTDSILMNGRGNWTNPDRLPDIKPPGPHRETFKKGTRYLLRIINTAVGSTFVFSIDNHNLTIVGADSVPIHPYSNDSILVGIGQRYHVIVEANPIDNGHLPDDGNYWMRAIPATDCFSFANTTDEKVGVVTYDGFEPIEVPHTVRSNFSIACSDETYTSLVPVVPWTIGRPVNPQGGAILEAGFTIPPSDSKVELPHGGFSRWSLGDHPLWLNLTDPTMLEIGRFDDMSTFWDPELVVLDANYAADDWVYLIITATSTALKDRPRRFVPGAHPIHLHGHDFALLAQSDTPYWERLTDLKFDNPPRRDVALLPANGYIVIAFRADNPGAWLLHCHIAWHVSSGLAIQILERQTDLVATYLNGDGREEWNKTRDQCNAWKESQNNRNNWWDPALFQDDSGV